MKINAIVICTPYSIYMSNGGSYIRGKQPYALCKTDNYQPWANWGVFNRDVRDAEGIFAGSVFWFWLLVTGIGHCMGIA